jgi:hypothetical protein
MIIRINVKATDIAEALHTLAKLPVQIQNIRGLHAYIHEGVYLEDAFPSEVILVLSDVELDIDGKELS